MGTLEQGVISFHVSIVFNTASSAASQIPICWRMLDLSPGPLQSLPWQPDVLATRPDLIHIRLDLIQSIRKLAAKKKNAYLLRTRQCGAKEIFMMIVLKTLNCICSW